MLIPILHRKRKAAEAAAKAIKGAGGAIEQTRRIYGTRLLIRGLLWLSVYLLSHGLLELVDRQNAALRVAIALLPMVFFGWYLWTWMKGVSEMDELERRIELEALGFAFPATLVTLMTIGLLDLAVRIDPGIVSFHRIWLVLPVLYYAGLWRAKRRYQ
jgi:hypothetical protein